MLSRTMVCMVLGLALLAASATATTYYVSTTGNDNNPGTLSQPFLHIGKGVSVIHPGDTLDIRGGTYRLQVPNTFSWGSMGDGTATSNVTIQAYPGERVVILGSINTSGRTWQQYTTNVWRTDASFLPNDPKGMFDTNHSALLVNTVLEYTTNRIAHAMRWVSGSRSHGNASQLTAPDEWTKADANGVGCGSSNTGCYIYLYPPNGENPNNHVYELSQRGLGIITSNHITVRNLEIYYTQATPIFFTGANDALIENNIFGHTSYGNDNSYGMRIWDSGGDVIQNNTVFDSVYWGLGDGENANSKGITFMITDPNNPIIVQNNTIYDIPGRAAVGTKDGSSHIIVRYNHIYNVDTAFEPGGDRCTDNTYYPQCTPGMSKWRPGGNWQIYGNIVENATTGVSLTGYVVADDNNTIYNNVFYGGSTAIYFGHASGYWDQNTSAKGSHGDVFANNIFMDHTTALYLQGGGSGVTPNDFLTQYTSHNNVFYNNVCSAADNSWGHIDVPEDFHIHPTSQGSGCWWAGDSNYTVSQYQSLFSTEQGSIGSDPLFVDPAAGDFHLQSGSPAKGTGDASYWSASSVDIGAYPNGGSTVTPPPPSTSTPGDLNGDGLVDLQDLILEVENIHKTSGYTAGADLNGDGTVNIFDLVMLVHHWTGGSYGALHGHEPTGFTLIVQRDFNQVNATGWDFYCKKRFSLGTDASAPQSPPSIGVVTFESGYSGEGITGCVVGYSGWARSDAYVEFWFKVSKNWQGHTSGVNKIFYLTDSSTTGGGNPFYFEVHGTGSNPLYFGITRQGSFTPSQTLLEWNGAIPTGAPNEVTVNASDAQVVRGKWYHIEVLVNGSTPGVANGAVQAWLDGKEILKYTNFETFPSSSDGTLNSLRWEPIWGGISNTNVTNTMEQYMDGIYLSGK